MHGARGGGRRVRGAIAVGASVAIACNQSKLGLKFVSCYSFDERKLSPKLPPPPEGGGVASRGDDGPGCPKHLATGVHVSLKSERLKSATMLYRKPLSTFIEVANPAFDARPMRAPPQR